MFVYQNKEHTKIYIALNSNRPKDFPDYILELENNELKVNNSNILPIQRINLPETDITEAIIIDRPAFFNLAGKTITANGDTIGDGVFHVVGDGVLTIDGDGIINSVGPNDYSMAVWADGGKVIINNGTFTNIGAGEHDHYDLIYVKNNGYVEINGGYFECQTPKWTLNSHNTLPGTIVVKGGTFKNYNPAESYTDENGAQPTSFVAPGYAVKQDGELFTVYKL